MKLILIKNWIKNVAVIYDLILYLISLLLYTFSLIRPNKILSVISCVRLFIVFLLCHPPQSFIDLFAIQKNEA